MDGNGTSPAPAVEVERLSWPDGSWWDILLELPYGVKRRMERASVKGLKVQAAALTDADSMREALTGEQAMEMADASVMAQLVGCTVAWSWPDPVDETSIDARPAQVVERVKARMAELYAARTEAEVAAIKKA